MFLVMYLALSNVIQFAIGGNLLIYHGLWLCIFVVIGTVIGQNVLKKMIQKTGRSSVIIWALFGIILLAMVSSGVFDTLSILEDNKAGNNIWEFENLCDNNH